MALAGCGGKRMPALSAVVDAPLLRPGSTWTYRIEDTSFPQPVTTTYVFDREDVYKGAGVLSFTVGQETLLYDRDLNFIAVAAGEPLPAGAYTSTGPQSDAVGSPAITRQSTMSHRTTSRETDWLTIELTAPVMTFSRPPPNTPRTSTSPRISPKAIEQRTIRPM
jgi:hypothetical protein